MEDFDEFIVISFKEISFDFFKMLFNDILVSLIYVKKLF